MISRFVAVLCLLAVSFGAPPKVVSPEEAAKWQADVRVFRDQAPKVHRDLFNKMKPNVFADETDRLEADIPKLTREQIIVRLGKIVGMIGDGHTNMNPAQASFGFRRLPVKFYSFTDGLYIISAQGEGLPLLGARVTMIGRASAEKALTEAGSIFGSDNEFDARWMGATALQIPEVLFGLGLTPASDTTTITAEKDAKSVSVTLKPIGPADSISPHAWQDGEPGWQSSIMAATKPLWLKNPHEFYWSEYLPEQKTLSIQYNGVANKEGGETIAQFFQRVIEKDTTGAEKLILDMRLNGGGNNALNQPIIHALIRSDKFNQRGKLFTIIGRQTFSAAQNGVNELEKHTNTLFVGEPTGARPNHYGDATRIVLPNNNVAIGLSTIWWQDTDPRDRRQFTAPQIAAELSFSDYKNGRDPALEAIFNYANKPGVAQLVDAAVKANDMEAARNAVMSFKNDPANKYLQFERDLNLLGYRYKTQNDLPRALMVFRLNTEAYPDGFNTWDSLAEAELQAGDHKAALEHYEKSLALNPQNGNARGVIERLKQGRR